MSTSIFSRLRSWLGGGRDGGRTVRPDGGQTTTAAGSVGEEETADQREVDTPEQQEFTVSVETLIDGISEPTFVIGPEGHIMAWNQAMAELTGISDDDALGRADIGMLLYESHEETMIEEVLAAPKTADEEYGLTVADASRHLYVKEDRVVDHTGNVEHYARVTVMPLYEHGELVGAIEMIQDLTAERQQQEATEALVDEVSGTLQALSAGNLDARASFSDDDAIDSNLLDVVTEVNEMAENLQDIVVRVDQQASHLGESVDRAVSAADDIATNVHEQNELLVEGVDEIQALSANMEEVAATAEEVEKAAESARDAADDGLDVSKDARTATDEVTNIGEELVENVTELGERMDEIGEVVEVISDVAEQTNLLALNANIEAARAGDDGDGFAVVANEVKTLADETSQHTEQITRDIDKLQSQTESTVVAAEQSHQEITAASDQIDDVLAAFEDIASSIEEAADGIGEVSHATDDQAKNIEELTSTLEEARDHASATADAADNVVAATDDQSEAIAELEARVQTLRD